MVSSWDTRARRWHDTTYVFQVGVAPHFAVGEHARHDPALLVNVGPLAHGPALQPRQAPVEEIGHVDSSQATAGQPQEGPAQLVVDDAQREFAVVVVDLLRADVAVIVDGQQVPAVHLREGRRLHSVRGVSLSLWVYSRQRGCSTGKSSGKSVGFLLTAFCFLLGSVCKQFWVLLEYFPSHCNMRGDILQ